MLATASLLFVCDLFNDLGYSAGSSILKNTCPCFFTHQHYILVSLVNYFLEITLTAILLKTTDFKLDAVEIKNKYVWGNSSFYALLLKFRQKDLVFIVTNHYLFTHKIESLQVLFPINYMVIVGYYFVYFLVV